MNIEWAVSFRTWAPLSDPGAWAAAREAEGWGALGVADHIRSGANGCLHAFPVLGQFAARTEHVQLFPCFGNNLVRSPVEFAQLARTIQHLSNGRFEAGIGAGWDAAEITDAGLPYPPGPERARRFREAVLVVRELLRGSCHFDGEFYKIDFEAAGPDVSTPPPIFAALGGEWTIRNIGPLVDRIELFANAPAFRSGQIDFGALATITRDDFRRLIATAREAAPDASIGAGFFVATGDRPEVEWFARQFADGFCSGLAGDPTEVADTLHTWADEGLDRITVLPPLEGTIEPLAAALLSDHMRQPRRSPE